MNLRSKGAKPVLYTNTTKVETLSDIIQIGKELKMYKNINSIMLWRIMPLLEELNNMIGMTNLKKTILYQILYYLQDMHLKNNDEYLHTIIMGSPGHGKCFKVNTPVIMFDGTIKMIQNIKEGDTVMGDDSTVRNVLNVSSGYETMFKVSQDYGDDYTVNKSHILSLMLVKPPKIVDDFAKKFFGVSWFSFEKMHTKTFNYSFRSKEIVYAEVLAFEKALLKIGSIIDIPIIDYINRPKSWKSAFKGYKTAINFQPVAVELDPYIAGYWIGKGIENTPCIQCEYETIVEYFQKVYPNMCFMENKNTWIIVPFDQEKQKNTFVDDLKALNVFEKRQRIPSVFKTNTNEVRAKILSGLIDSIGTLSGSIYSILHENKEFIDDIAFLVSSLGFRYETKKTAKFFRIMFGGFTDTLPVLLEENKTHLGESKIDFLSYDIEVGMLDQDDYYGIVIDGNHRFVLGDFTVVHNTEAAKIIGKIYQQMGILSENSSFRIAYRDDLVAEYVGQTAIKTRKLLESCLGGVLFIDEVYSLGSGQKDKDTFSKEALDTLTGFLSEHKTDFCCIAAGYEEDIKKCFFGSNKGLERRFPWIHKIDNYTEFELAEIFLIMVKNIKWSTDVSKKDISSLIKKNKDFFRNAGGDIETYLTKCKIVHSKRVFSMDSEHKFVINLQDMINAIELIREKKEEFEAVSLLYT